MTSYRHTVTLTDEQKARHAEIRRQIGADKPRLMDEARRHLTEREALMDAFARLKAERDKRGLSLAAVSDASGIDKSYLSKLENDPYPNPTLSTLMRVADAIGVRLTLGIVDKEAA